MLFQRRDLGITKIIHEHNITEAVHGEERQWFFQPPAFKCPSQPQLHHIRECRMPFSDPVCGQERQCLVIGASDCRNNAMPHLSTHSQQVTLACSPPKPKGDFSIIKLTVFLGNRVNAAMEKFDCIRQQMHREINIWREDTLARWAWM